MTLSLQILVGLLSLAVGQVKAFAFLKTSRYDLAAAWLFVAELGIVMLCFASAPHAEVELHRTILIYAGDVALAMTIGTVILFIICTIKRRKGRPSSNP